MGYALAELTDASRHGTVGHLCPPVSAGVRRREQRSPGAFSARSHPLMTAARGSLRRADITADKATAKLTV